MSEYVEQPFQPDQEIERINEIGIQTAAEVMRIVCGRLILMSHNVIDYYLQKDADHWAEIEDKDEIGNRIIKLYVLHTGFTAPKNEDQFVDTLSIRVQPDKTSDGRYMKLHIPLGGISAHEFRTPDEGNINEMYVEEYDGTSPRWYAVNRIGLSKYVPIGKEDTEWTDDEIWDWIQERIPAESTSIIERLMQQAVNWQTVPQRDVRL